ncbi:MAG: GAF domain-containing protein, partial [Planctomycetota bacterium]|nr:GAF domain-containing protein [Planctomycetota bacterium]
MSDAAPVPTPTDPKLRVISAAQAPLAPEEPGTRPLPWPLWKGRYGSLPRTVAVAALWLVSLALALLARKLGADALASGFPAPAFLGSLALHLPWTIAVLWLLYAGFGYGAVLLLACAAAAPEPLAGKPWFSEPFALIVFAGLQLGFPFSTRLRGLPSFGLFVLAAFCAAAADGMAGLISDNRDTLVSFERLWAGHMAQDLLVTAPLAFLLGTYIERRKRLAFGALPIPRTAVRQQLLGLLVALAAVTAFCITWTAAADQFLAQSIAKRVADPHMRAALEQAQRVTALRKAALVALLLGAVCSGASLIVLVFRRYRQELRAEVQRNTEALRRRHLQLAALQQVTESANRSLDPDTVFSEMAQCMARLTDAAQVTVYVPDPQHAGYLKLVQEVCQRPPRFEHRARIPIDGSITGQSFRTNSIVTIPQHLPVYIDVESVRAQFQQHKLEAFLGVPIVSERAVLGVVSLTFDRSYAPDEEEHRLFRLIGHAVGAALELAETHTKARRYAGELGGLYRFSQQLAAAGEEAQFLPVAASAARRLLGAQATALFLAPAGNPSGPLRCVACDGTPEKLAALRDVSFTPHDHGLLAEAVRELRSVGVGVRMPAAAPQVLAGSWLERSALVVPLPAVAAEAGPAGAFVWVFDGQMVIGLEESGLAEEVARQTLAGLRRSRLLEKTRQQAEEL